MPLAWLSTILRCRLLCGCGNVTFCWAIKRRSKSFQVRGGLDWLDCEGGWTASTEPTWPTCSRSLIDKPNQTEPGRNPTRANRGPLQIAAAESSRAPCQWQSLICDAGDTLGPNWFLKLSESRTVIYAKSLPTFPGVFVFINRVRVQSAKPKQKHNAEPHKSETMPIHLSAIMGFSIHKQSKQISWTLWDNNNISLKSYLKVGYMLF